MLTVQGITADAYQTQNALLQDGTKVGITLRYVPQQLGWFMDLTYLEFALYSFRVSALPNILNQYRNKLPFGMACFTSDGVSPSQQQDFSSGYATLYILTPEEISYYLGLLSGG
jgi:hypothetical protein